MIEIRFMDIENIISKIIDRNFSTYEQERLTVLNALLGNIDILMNRSEEWFGDKIPEEYSRVIRSLFSLSAFLLEKKKSSFEASKVEKFHELNLHSFLLVFVDGLKNILDFGEMKIIALNDKHELMIRSSEIILKEAFYNIFFSIYPFMQKNSSCLINLSENRLNITVEFNFESLSRSFPGASELKKNIYSYRQGEYDKVGIGIDSAIASLRGAGAIVRINELALKESFSLSIMFPALDFYTGLEHVRGSAVKSEYGVYAGDILLQITDPFMKLFLTDTLTEHGYNIISSSISEIDSGKDRGFVKAVVIEYSDETSELLIIPESILIHNLKVIIICNENDVISKPLINSVIKVIKPFNIEELIDRIENG